MPTASAADVERVSYQWDSILREWYVNGESLEHGYTLSERPGQGAGLRFLLEVRGTLRAQVAPNGRSVAFVEYAGGARVINYSGLKVTDAVGRELSAQFRSEDEGLRLDIDDLEARYPITVDPIVELAYLKAANAGAGDWFGYSVAVHDGFVVVGAPNEASNGSNGRCTPDDSKRQSGAAYVFFQTVGGSWREMVCLKASNADAFDGFGYSVAIGNDSFYYRVVVGAWGEDGSRADRGLVNPTSNLNTIRGRPMSSSSYRQLAPPPLTMISASPREIGTRSNT